MDLTLPLDHAAIERILLHRYPFLLVDRVTELEIDKRIVGIKNVSRNDHYLSAEASGASVFPPTLLAGIKRFRFRRAVLPGEVIEMEARVIRLGSRMGVLEGVARVNGKTVAEG